MKMSSTQIGVVLFVPGVLYVINDSKLIAVCKSYWHLTWAVLLWKRLESFKVYLFPRQGS